MPRNTAAPFRMPGGWTAIPNTFFDAIVPTLGHAELKCLLYLLRHTLGYGKTQDAIALSQFKAGVVRTDGTRLDAGTGLGIAAIMAGLKGLEGQGLIAVTRRTSRNGRTATNTYAVRMDALGDAVPFPAADTIQANPTAHAPRPSGGQETRSDSPLSVQPRIATRDTIEIISQRKKEICVDVPYRAKEFDGGDLSKGGLVYPNKREIHHTEVNEANPLPNGQVMPLVEKTPPGITVDTPAETEDFVSWWCLRIAAHLGHRPRQNLTDTDRATLGRWHTFGASDAELVRIVSALLESDIEGKVYALAYLDQPVRRALAQQKTHVSHSALHTPSSPSRASSSDAGKVPARNQKVVPEWWTRYAASTGPQNSEDAHIGFMTRPVPDAPVTPCTPTPVTGKARLIQGETGHSRPLSETEILPTIHNERPDNNVFSDCLRPLCLAMLAILKTQLPRPIYDAWLAHVQLLRLSDGEALLGVPSSYGRRYIEERYVPLLERVLSDVVGRPCHVHLSPRNVTQVA